MDQDLRQKCLWGSLDPKLPFASPASWLSQCNIHHYFQKATEKTSPIPSSSTSLFSSHSVCFVAFSFLLNTLYTNWNCLAFVTITRSHFLATRLGFLNHGWPLSWRFWMCRVYSSLQEALDSEPRLLSKDLKELKWNATFICHLMISCFT